LFTSIFITNIYTQGYHDVVSVLMLVLNNDDLAYITCEAISLNYLRDYMNADFKILSRSLHIIMTIIEHSDQQLYHFLKEGASIEPYFATSWLITWFSHDIKSIDTVSRLFDVLLSTSPIYIYYLSAAVRHIMVYIHIYHTSYHVIT